MLDPRFIGEMAVPSGSFASAVSLLLGEHIPWRQATDILRTLRRVGGVTPGIRRLSTLAAVTWLLPPPTLPQ
jgi:hypothetical protein